MFTHLLDRLDPRRSLLAAIGWTLSALFLAGAYGASHWVGELTRSRLEAQSGRLYQQYALQISNVLDTSLYDRLQWIRATASMFSDEDVGRQLARQRALLERLQTTLPEFEWIGFADAAGKVHAATDGVLESQSVKHTRWFSEAQKNSWVGDVYDSAAARPSNAQAAGATVRTERSRVIDLTAPVRDADNGVVGAIGAQLTWSWIAQLEASLIEGLKSGRPIESLIVDRAGVVLLGPGPLLGTRLDLPGQRGIGAVGHEVYRWPDGIDYVAGYAVSDGVATFPGLGWTVWVREPTESAFADARAMERRIFAGMLLLGLIGAAGSLIATRRLTRELSSIARSADAIRDGKATALVVPPGEDEAARIGQSLRSLVDGLQSERAALQSLNAELDARVAARTRALERMSEENKYAAIVRERLRMARDLHDTLAHSMMALLTEIRLLRKLADTNPAALRDELTNAEGVAKAGLEEARAAITALRHNAVRDIGLGVSLAQFFKRFAERKGIAAAFHADSRADALADSRAETVYRIFEEALRNIELHASATRIEGAATVESGQDGSADGNETLLVWLADNGVGFNASAPRPGHFGMRGMREQAEIIGAQLQVQSTPGQGTRVTIRMPI